MIMIMIMTMILNNISSNDNDTNNHNNNNNNDKWRDRGSSAMGDRRVADRKRCSEVLIRHFCYLVFMCYCVCVLYIVTNSCIK